MLSSSSGPGCYPLTVEITGSNPVGSIFWEHYWFSNCIDLDDTIHILYAIIWWFFYFIIDRWKLDGRTTIAWYRDVYQRVTRSAADHHHHDSVSSWYQTSSSHHQCVVWCPDQYHFFLSTVIWTVSYQRSYISDLSIYYARDIDEFDRCVMHHSTDCVDDQTW